MKQEFSKGYYAMKEKMYPNFLIAVEHNNHFEDEFCLKTCEYIIKRRINERGYLGGESFANLCKLEGEFIIKLFQLDYANEEEIVLIKKRMSELKYLIDNLQLLVSEEFKAKSFVLETNLKRERELEKRKKNNINLLNQKFNKELKYTLIAIFLGILAIPILIFIMKGGF